MIQRKLLQWQLQLDRMELKQRIIICGSLLLITYLIWVWLVFHPIKEKINHIEQQIDQTLQETTKLNQQTQFIQSGAVDPSTQRLSQRYLELEKNIADIENKITKHHYTTISADKITDMLHALLSKVDDVKIENFITISPGQEESETDSTNIREILSPPEEETAASPSPVSPTIIPNYYELELTGSYFPIQTFLYYLENLDWKLYWDELDYKVKKYPEASIKVKFHTITVKKNDESKAA